MEGKWNWKEAEKRDVDFNRATRFQNGYSMPGSMYVPAPADNGMEILIENILEIQNRSYSELSVKMDHLFLDFNTKINLLRGDVGKLWERMESLEQHVGARRQIRRPGVIRALQAEESKKNQEEKVKTIGRVDRLNPRVDRLFSPVDQLTEKVARLMDSGWEFFPANRPLPSLEEEGLPLMKELPENKSSYKNKTLHSVAPWITIEGYNLDELSFDCEDITDHMIRRKITPYVNQMLIDMPFIRACHLEKKLEEIAEDIVKLEMTPEMGANIITRMCDGEIRYRVPDKRRDPGDFLINITIGGARFEDALCDLGASCNTISIRLAAQLRLRGMKNTEMTFKLADNSHISPVGKIDDVPIMIGDRFIAIDFYILGSSYTGIRSEDEQIILGREFLITAGALIDCIDNSVTLRNLGKPYLKFKFKEEDAEDEEDYFEDYEEFFKQNYKDSKKPQKGRLAVLTRSVAKIRVHQNPGEIMIRKNSSRPTPPEVDRLATPEPKRRVISMPSLTPMRRSIISTSMWFQPEHIEAKIPQYYRNMEVTREQVKTDTEGLIEECKEIWPLIEQCNIEGELRRYVSLLIRRLVTAQELCDRMSSLCDKEISKKVPRKLEDTGKPTIGCMIGYTWFEKAVCDTGAGVNLMSLSAAKLLGYDKLLDRKIILRLADGRLKYTEGMIEDVPLHTRSQFFAVDFHVMEYEEDTEEPLILGRPFLNTAHAEISCKTGKVAIRAKEARDEEKIQMNGNRPAGFSYASPKGTFQPMSRDMRYTSTRKHMYTASVSFARVKEEEPTKIVDLTEVEEDPEEDPEEDLMEDEEAEDSDHDFDPTYK